MKATQQQTSPKLSVILVSYRRPDYLKEAVQSMFDQTFQDWELIILDNSPAEDTGVREVCEWATADQRVRVIYHGRNTDNLAIDWNEGLDLARGDYWGLLDDDDRKHPICYEKMIGYLETHPDKYAVVCGVRFIGAQSGHRMATVADVDTLRVSNKIGSGEIVYRRTVIDKIGYFDERMVSQEDWDYVLRFFSVMGRDSAGFLGELLADYRWHPAKRMVRSHELKMVECAHLIQNKYQPAKLRVLVRTPDQVSVTASQRQVTDGVRSGVDHVPFVEVVSSEPDVVVFVGPLYHLQSGEVAQTKQVYGVPTIGLFMEDPQGIGGNLPALNELDWVVTNDIHAFELYKTLFHTPGQVYQWNCLSISDAVMDLCVATEPAKKYDLCFIGDTYAPSRVQFIKQLRALLPHLSMVLVGDRWDQCGIRGAVIYPTLNELETAKIGLRSKIIICKHRTQADLGGFPVVLPGNVNRGYIECAYRALVMIDRERHHSSFTDEVEWYESVDDLARKIKEYLRDPNRMAIKVEKASARARSFTYKERLGRILNGFRSPRYNLVVP